MRVYENGWMSGDEEWISGESLRSGDGDGDGECGSAAYVLTYFLPT